MRFPLPETDEAGVQPVELEDRIAPRFTLLIRPGKLHVGSAQYVCVMRDISATGVSTRLFHDIAWKGPIVLELQTGDRFPMELVWHRDNEAGFQFFDQIEVEQAIGHCSLYPKRDLRFEIPLPIKVQAGGVSHAADIANLSRQGALLDCEASLAIGQAIMLNAKGLPTIEARVRWRRAHQYGLVFDTTFSLAELAVLIDRLQAPGAKAPTRVALPLEAAEQARAAS